MNRLILKYGYPITAVILLVFAWVIYRRLAGGVDAIIPLAVAADRRVGARLARFIYFWPRITVGGFKRAILQRGFGGGPIPVNTLYAVPDRSSQSASTSSVMAIGTDDVLYIGGWLDVKAGPQVMHVPEMARTLLQRAVHRSDERCQLRLRRKTDHRDLHRRLRSLRTRLEG